MAESKSLWNASLSPGWTAQEAETFRCLIIGHGAGRWKQIHATGYLPGKTVGQLNVQFQRMIGQQRTAEFHGIHFDTHIVLAENKQRQGKRKHGYLVQAGNPSKEETKRLRAANEQRLPQEEMPLIPVLKTTDLGLKVGPLTREDRRERLERLAWLQSKLNHAG